MKKSINIILVFVLMFSILFFAKKDDEEKVIKKELGKIVINVNDRDLIVELEDNSSAESFYERLKKESIRVKAHDYGSFEKVGDLGFELPRNDKTFDTKAGDLILYQGNQITLYYDTNRWSFTKLGHVTNVDPYDLKDLLGKGDVELKFSIKR